MQTSQVAVITGAAQGIGRAIAIELASHGYSVALGDVPSKQQNLKQVADKCRELQKNLGPSHKPKVYYSSCDVSVEAQVEELVEVAVSELGGIDVMVANAGIYAASPLLETSDDMFDRLYAINIKGALYSYRAAAKAMIPRGGGRIIGACSRAGITGLPNNGAYGCSKSAIRTLTQTAAREWGRYNITVNAYAPGPVDTDMYHSGVLGSIRNETGTEYTERVLSNTPTGKITASADIAGLVAFLVSPAAKNITGNLDKWWNSHDLIRAPVSERFDSWAEDIDEKCSTLLEYEFEFAMISHHHPCMVHV